MIQRRKPLARSTKPIARSPLKRVSKKHAKELRTYSKLRKAFLEEHTTCQAHTPACWGPVQDIHHVFGRGKYLNAIGTWLAICRPCHIWVHDYPSEARTRDLLQ